MANTDTCTCGHVLDEHEPECLVDDCDCIHFEALDDDD